MEILNNELFLRVKTFVRTLHSPLFFVHSDLLKGFQVKLRKFNTNDLLEAHIKLLQEIVDPAQLWFPAFNLDYPKTRIHDVINTPSQMGHLSEYFRQNIATWRDEIPMHSCCGTGMAPPLFETENGVCDPWSKNSLWAQLSAAGGYLLFYGAGLDAISFLHYTEKKIGVPYRFQKLFPGALIDKNGESRSIIGSHIVRPMGYNVHYDWDKLKGDLQQAGIWHELSDRRTRILLIPAKELDILWTEKLEKDPLYFLDHNTLAWVKPMLNKLNRPFTQADFEP